MTNWKRHFKKFKGVNTTFVYYSFMNFFYWGKCLILELSSCVLSSNYEILKTTNSSLDSFTLQDEPMLIKKMTTMQQSFEIVETRDNKNIHYLRNLNIPSQISDAPQHL